MRARRPNISKYKPEAQASAYFRARGDSLARASGLYEGITHAN